VSGEDNKAVVRRWIEAYNNRDTQAEADARAPGYVAHAPGLPGPLNSEAWSQVLASFTEAFPDLRLTVEDIFCGGGHGRGPCCLPRHPPWRVPGLPADRQASGLLKHRDQPRGGRQGGGALVRDGPARSDGAARRHPRAGALRGSQLHLACSFSSNLVEEVLGRSVASHRTS
jgi:hypothetical protein